ncbi:MAG: UDP-N-acetylmuramoyl-tripeptide--D-alanyl-D-alanine ligase [Actinomycetota bacterium]
MEEVKVKDIQSWTGAKIIDGGKDCFIDSISTDSRTLERGQFFIPLKGENFDGHDYIGEAIYRGACGFVYEQGCEGRFNRSRLSSGHIVLRSRSNHDFIYDLAYHYIRRVKPTVIGITGSVGKTTTKDMLVSILGRKHRVCFTPRNYNNEIGVPKAVLEMDKDAEFFVAELAMRKKGQIRKLAEMVDVDMAVITAVGESHLEFFENIQQIALAKAEIAHGLGRKGGILFLNHDNQWTSLIKEKAGCRILEFGKDNNLDYNFMHERPDLYGRYRFAFCRKEKELASISLNIAGYHNIYNGCAAAAVSDRLGMGGEDIGLGIEKARIEGCRMDVFEKSGKIIISDCYNASPLSVACALDTLKHIAGVNSGRSVAILSDMLELGKNTAKMHHGIGEMARKKDIDLLLSFGKLARYIYEGYRGKGGTHFESRQQLMDNIKGILRKGDVVLIKGSRANKMEDIVKEI